MAKIIVKKSNPLKGSVKIDGAKNAVLPIIAATLLANGKSTLNGEIGRASCRERV